MSYNPSWGSPVSPASPFQAADYASFIDRKSQGGALGGFEPVWMPDFLFDFQKFLVEWNVRKGRAAIFADCGLGKTPMQLVWAQNVVERTNGWVLLLTPLAVGGQTLAEGEKFGIECGRSRDGNLPSQRIVITNYEKLHLFNPDDFAGVVCDESSILKHFKGATQAAVTQFMRKVPYRLLCTATAAPNDYMELGTSSEVIGELGYVDMLSRFFKADGNYHAMNGRSKMGQASQITFQQGHWRLKGHAATPFWRWIASWARACRKPSDLGFDDGAFALPPLVERSHIIMPQRPPDGMLLTLPAIGLQEERDERRRTLADRCALVTDLVDHDGSAVIWCHLNIEGDSLARMIPNSVQVKGADSDEQKEEAYRAFGSGEIKRLIIKPKIGAWGLNWQHCNHVVTFASHSYEQYYQSVRRCWRFGQKSPVTVDIVATEGERRVQENMARKAAAADHMFTELISHMADGLSLTTELHQQRAEAPSWLTSRAM